MTFYEGVVLVVLAANAYALYRIGKMEVDIDTMYQGLAMCMKEVGISEDEE
jgi:hypothetical protein